MNTHNIFFMEKNKFIYLDTSLIRSFASVLKKHPLLKGLDKSGYQVNIFLISPRKRMLWVLIRSASPRHF